MIWKWFPSGIRLTLTYFFAFSFFLQIQQIQILCRLVCCLIFRNWQLTWANTLIFSYSLVENIQISQSLVWRFFSFFLVFCLPVTPELVDYWVSRLSLLLRFNLLGDSGYFKCWHAKLKSLSVFIIKKIFGWILYTR